MANLKELLKKENVSLIDVREAWEYNEAHVNNSVNIPLGEIPGRINEFKKMTGPVILYCRSGNRSGMAANFLKQAGIREVFNGGSIYDLQRL